MNNFTRELVNEGYWDPFEHRFMSGQDTVLQDEAAEILCALQDAYPDISEIEERLDWINVRRFTREDLFYAAHMESWFEWCGCCGAEVVILSRGENTERSDLRDPDTDHILRHVEINGKDFHICSECEEKLKWAL